MPYLSALEVCSRRGAIQIHIYLYLLAVPLEELNIHEIIGAGTEGQEH